MKTPLTIREHWILTLGLGLGILTSLFAVL